MRGRPKGSKNKQPYPITDAVLAARRAAAPKATASRRAMGYQGSYPTYLAVHKACEVWLDRKECVTSDGTCNGRLEFALRPDADEALIKVETKEGEHFGMRFFAGPLEEGYMVLCASHHVRMDRGWS